LHVIGDRSGGRFGPFLKRPRVDPFRRPLIMTNDSVDNVRRGEQKRLLKDGNDRRRGSKYSWLPSLENRSEKQHAKFQSICNLMDASGRAWPCKETLRDLWAKQTEGGKGLLQTSVSASHSYQDGTDEKNSTEFEGANR